MLPASMDAGIVERQRINGTVIGYTPRQAIAAIAGWLYKALSRHDSRLPGEEPAVAHDCGSSWTILILRMLQVSLRQGSSIPRALDMMVGKAVGGDCGARMSEVGNS